MCASSHPELRGDGELLCLRCGAILERGEGKFYVVRIEAFADPSPPVIRDDETLEGLAAEWETLLAQMDDQSERELLDQVYRRLTLLLCTPCYRSWIEHPVGDAPGE